MCDNIIIISLILVSIFLALSVNTIINRRKYGLALGEGDSENLKRAVRAHGNFIEYTPIFLITLLILDQKNGSCEYILYVGVAFIIGRIIHALSLFIKKGLFRVIGMNLTFLPLLFNLIYLSIVLIKN